MTISEPVFENIPEELKAAKRWVCWRIEERKGNLTKVPYRSDGKGMASSTDPSSWGTFDDAVSTYQIADYSGVGFVLGDGWAGIDLDDCINDSGSVETWAADIVSSINSYAEISPSGTGVKMLVRGAKPADIVKTKRERVGPDGVGDIEIYDKKRYFAITGDILPDIPAEVREVNGEFDALCRRFLSGQDETTIATADVSEPNRMVDRQLFNECLASMLRLDMIDGGDGSKRLFASCCRTVEYGLNDEQAVQCVRAYASHYPFPTTWADADIIRRVVEARRTTSLKPELLEKEQIEEPLVSVNAAELCRRHPDMRPEVIYGLARETETVNLIASSKVGKTFFAVDLGISIATGNTWLGRFPTRKGAVLYIDCELHPNTFAKRLNSVSHARGVMRDQYAPNFEVLSLRGRLKDINQLGSYFRSLDKGRFTAIVLDAWYRLLPVGCDENSNADITALFNKVDQYADMTGATFIIVHHSSKGSQGQKSVVDVGSGAGAMSRATDSHVILRPHEEEDAVVMDAACRSFAPLQPVCLRWTHPVWNPDETLDPTQLRQEGRRRSKKEAVNTEAAGEPQIAWTPAKFVETFITDSPVDRKTIIAKAAMAELTGRKAESLLQVAVADKLAFRWSFAGDRVVYLANHVQPVTAVKVPA